MDRPYTVKLISASFSENSGSGVIEYSVRLAKALENEKSIKVYNSAVIKGNVFLTPKRVYRSLDTAKKIKNPDLLHYTDPAMLLKNAIFAGYFLHKSKLIVTVHDLYMFRSIEPRSKIIKSKIAIIKRPFSLKSSIKRFVNLYGRPISIITLVIGLRFAVKHSDRIICVSEKTRDLLVNKFGIDRKKCEVIYPIISKEFKPMNVKKGKKIIIGHISSYFPNKNVGVLIDAFKELVDSNFELHLYGGALPFRIDDDKRIKYYGFIPTKDIPKVMNSFDVFVFPSAYEGFGMPAIEAKRCKIPVITYKKGELPDIVKRNTLQFMDKKDLVNLLKSKKWSIINLDKAYNDTRKCEPQYVAKQITELYKEVIKNKNE